MVEEVRVLTSVDEIGKSSVDSLAVDGFFTYGWFKAVETQSSIKVPLIYLAVYQDDRVVAVAPCFVDLIGHFFSFGPKLMPFFQRILMSGQKLGLYSNHALLCCSPFCFRSKVLFDGAAEQKRILGLIAKKLDLVCKERRFLFSAFLFVSEFDGLLMDNLASYGFIRFPNITTYYLDIKWGSFDEYLKSLKPRRRRAIEREIKKFQEFHSVASPEEFGVFSEKFSELAANLSSKYSDVEEKSVLGSLFCRLDEYNADNSKVFIAEKNGDMAGFSVSLRHADVLDLWITGFDYSVQTNTDFAYFNLCYYLPIRWAIDEGITKIYYRFESENAKIKRGCVPERNFAFVKCNSRILSALINGALRSKMYWRLKARYLH